MNRILIITDIDQIVGLRFDFIATETDIDKKDRESLTANLRKYFEEALSDGTFTAYGYFIDNKIVSTAFLITDKRPPGLKNPTGIYGTVMNVLTYSDFRGKGYATAVMKYLIGDAQSKGVKILDLYATGEGKPLYEKLGFKDVEYTAMWMKL
ncbi:MAG: GNAT family N-acetyltransferase [Dysgonomonas mossii]|uniref:GNAT family N-acetyltransferase n=1 Tax=Dysgonomonas mossii TaxID=163665 RepID=UPI0039912534